MLRWIFPYDDAEIPHYKRVSVKLEEKMVERLDGLADEHGVTRSDVIRNTLDDGLNTGDDAEIQRLEGKIEDL